MIMRAILGVLIEALHSLDEKIAVLDVEISRRAEEDEDARRLKTIPGIGPVTAAAISALAPPARLAGPQKNGRSSRPDTCQHPTTRRAVRKILLALRGAFFAHLV